MQSKPTRRCWFSSLVCSLVAPVLVSAQQPLEGTILESNVAGSGCTHDIECDDGLPCTTDWCDFPAGGPAGSGTCQHAPVPNGQPGGVGGPDWARHFGLLCGGCDDGLICNGAETCQDGSCAPGTPPCSGGEVCSEPLDRCQPGPCSEQRTCIGGPTPGAACTGNNNCGNGGLCKFADCEDGLLCNGEETCVAGVCQAGENPCGYGAECGERQCSVGASIDHCLTDEDCAGGLGTCSYIGPVCGTGRCCTVATEPACTRRVKRGTCGGTLGNAGAACSTGSECNSNTCNAYAGSCTGVGGLFYPGDVPGAPIPPGAGIACPVEVRCPKYGSGVTPHGAVVGAAGMVSHSNVANPILGVPMHSLGDDYTLSDPGICVGGTRNGWGCGVPGDCPSGGVCDSAGTSVMAVYYVRVLGKFIPNMQVFIEFYDAAGRFVARAYPQREAAAQLDRLWIDPPVIAPSRGFVVLRVASEFTPDGRFFWSSTNAVDVGFNDPNVLWVNDGPVANFLAPNPGILIFEIEGEQTVPPLGACCANNGSGCADGVLPWVCEGDGNQFQGVGTTCPAPACDTGACCNLSTGACSMGTQVDCLSAGGEFLGFGTECDADHGYDSAIQHCCPQPAPTFSGADTCEDVMLHVVTGPLPGATKTITITGDNSPASLQPGETPCYSGPESAAIDLGWYEGFESQFNCAMVRVDYCCTDPAKRPAYPALFDSCPCGAAMLSTANPYQFPQLDHERGSPYCDDENQWATFGPLPAGTYYIPVQSGVPGSFGPYQMHITVEACPLAACCVADQCTDGVNQFECDALGGVFLAPPHRVPAVSVCSSSPCATGSCCSSPGQCVDVVVDQPVTPSDCAGMGDIYKGGVRCYGGSCSGSPQISCRYNIDCPDNENCLGSAQQLSQPWPCPICEIAGTGNCQPYEDTTNFAVSDRRVGVAGVLAADDFKPDGDTLSQVCVWGFTLNGDPNAADGECDSFIVSDHFRVRVYNNDPTTGRVPGTLFGESTAGVEKGVNGPSRVQTLVGPATYAYQLTLDAPITGLTPGEIYWLEVSNDVSDANPNCIWFWMQRNVTFTSYSYTGTNDGYLAGFEAPFEKAFCTNLNFAGSTLGAILGPCCTCDSSCSARTFVDCANENGVWDVTQTSCTGVSCPAGAPANDACTEAITITEGAHIADNQCATTDGYGPNPSDTVDTQLDFDLWYKFVAGSECDLVVSECRSGRRFDTMLAVYNNCPAGAPPDCDKTVCPPCPFDAATSTAYLAGQGCDDNCSGIFESDGRWIASEQILRNAEPGECFLLRIGSFPGNRGTATFDVYCNDAYCIPHYRPPCEPYVVEYSRFLALGCDLFHPCANPIPVEGAIRVHLISLHHVSPPYTGGLSVPFTSFEGQVRWVGPPSPYIESSATPTPFWASRLQCTPHYQDWSTIPLLYVTGSEIVPSSTYQYELLGLTCQGNEDACTDFSPTVTVRTTRWGDVKTPYNPPDPSVQPDLSDVSGLVDKFKSVAGAPIKAGALLAGVDALGNVNLAGDFDFSHIAACVDAFRGKPYPYTITACP